MSEFSDWNSCPESDFWVFGRLKLHDASHPVVLSVNAFLSTESSSRMSTFCELACNNEPHDSRHEVQASKPGIPSIPQVVMLLHQEVPVSHNSSHAVNRTRTLYKTSFIHVVCQKNQRQSLLFSTCLCEDGRSKK